jgi:hypothetical protein
VTVTESPSGGARTASTTRGFTLVGVLILIVIASLLVSTTVALTVSAERSAGAAQRRARLATAAGAAAAELEELLLARVQATSGALRDADLSILNSTAPAEIELGSTDLSIEPGETGFRVIEVRQNDPIPSDAAPLAAWTDQPRLSYAGIPPVGGLVAARTVVVAVIATVHDATGAKFRVRRDLAVSQVPPHQSALYVAGDGEICASGTSENWVSGPVRVDGTLRALSCGNLVRYVGGVVARDGILVDAPAAHYASGTDGERPLATVTRAPPPAHPPAAPAPGGGRRIKSPPRRGAPV